jgi:hypothetical protein
MLLFFSPGFHEHFRDLYTSKSSSPLAGDVIRRPPVRLPCTDKKENQIFLISKEILNGAVAMEQLQSHI